MSHLLWLVSLVGLLCTAVVFGTDMFFLTVGRPALRLASPLATVTHECRSGVSWLSCRTFRSAC